MYTPTYILNQSEVIMMFQSGGGVEVVENQGFMTARVYLPWTYIVSIDNIHNTVSKSCSFMITKAYFYRTKHAVFSEIGLGK